MNTTLTPFVKWAGGKRQLLDSIAARMPKSYNRYIEPFVGGGAVCFALAQAGSYINDSNTALINTYRVIKRYPQKLIDEIRILDQKIISGKKEFYYDKRTRFNELLKARKYTTETAALFIFLNKHCFNGLYRVNSHGEFNVPYNQSIRPSINEENIRAISVFLQDIEIYQGDFAKVARMAQKGDFVFFDSPYAPVNPLSFDSYTKEGFPKKDHERLARLYRDLTDKGCFCMLTNHNTEFIRELYKDFRIETVSVHRFINADASKRTGKEIIICNY